VEFRIYGFQAEGSAGTWRIDNLELSAAAAAVSSVPDAGSGALLFVISGFALVAVRSRVCCSDREAA
jgi:hypothetical protein